MAPLILRPALKRLGPPKRQWLCSHPAYLWATSDFALRSEAVGTPRRKGLCSCMYVCGDHPTILTGCLIAQQTLAHVCKAISDSPGWFLPSISQVEAVLGNDWSDLLRIRGQNQRRPANGQGGYITTAARGLCTASQCGTESQVAHKWARWLHNTCRLGGPHRFRAENRIRGGSQVSKVATQPLPLGARHRFRALGGAKSGA